MDTELLVGLFGGRAKSASPFEILRFIFDNNLICAVPDFFIAIREYELGIEFAEAGILVTEQSKELLEDYIYRRWLQHLVLLKFEMLDRLNDIKGYLILFDELMTSEDPKWVSTCPTPSVPDDWVDYISYRDENGEAHLHFLVRIDWRKKIMLRKWKRFISGRPMGNQLRHQKEVLTDAQIIERADAFFQRLCVITGGGVE